MKRMSGPGRGWGWGFALAGVGALVLTSALAAPVEIKLPPEQARLRASSLPGFAIATQKCASCHSADYINYQPPGMNRVQWTAEVAKMRSAYGAPLADDEVQRIGAYLAVAYGTAKSTDADVLAASAAPAARTTGAGDGGDVQALLAANACLGCHAVAQKIVGPAYHDVAVKYRGDALALSRLEASIRQGSVGRWGQVAMPPFAGLSEAQASLLAAFVLKQ